MTDQPTISRPSAPSSFGTVKSAVASVSLLLLLCDLLGMVLVDIGHMFSDVFYRFAERIVGFFSGTTGFAAHALTESFFSSDAAGSLNSILYRFFVMLLPFLISVKREKAMPMPISFGRGTPFAGLFAAFALIQTFSSTASSFSAWFRDFLLPVLPFSAPSDAPSAGTADFIIYFIELCVFTPFAEEYIFRGVIFGRLRHGGFSTAAFWSALLFGLAHGAVPQMVYAFATGLMFAFVYEKTGSLWYSILFHALNNATNFLFADLLPIYLGEDAAYLCHDLYFFLCAGLSVFGFFALFMKTSRRTDGSRPFRKGEAESAIPMRRLVSAPVVLYILMFLRTAVIEPLCDYLGQAR